LETYRVIEILNKDKNVFWYLDDIGHKLTTGEKYKFAFESYLKNKNYNIDYNKVNWKQVKKEMDIHLD